MHFDVFVACLDKVWKTLDITSRVAANIDRLVHDCRIGGKGLRID